MKENSNFLWNLCKEIKVGKRKTRNFFLLKACLSMHGFFFNLPLCFELWNTTTYWLVWLFVTLVRQLGSDRLKARPVITTVANAQTFDPCVGPSSDYNPSLWKQAGLKSFASTCPITCVSHMISVKALTEVRSYSGH